MNERSALRDNLKRGALVTVANWPVVVIQFVAESIFKLLLGVPVVGGALLVALILGRDVVDVLSGDPREVVARITAVLLDHGGALASFVAGFGIVLLGGSAFMFLVKGGTVSVLLAGEGAASRIERLPVRRDTLNRAAAFSIDAFVAGCQRLVRPYCRLGLGLLVVYALSAVIYLLLLYAAGFVPAWTLLAAVLSIGLLLWITIVNLVYLLMQMTLAIEAGTVTEAARLVAAFLRARFRQVAGVFLVVFVLVLLATLASLVATTGLGLLSFIPLVGLAVLPIQAAAWLLRGLVFQYLGLTALVSYIAIYRGERGVVADPGFGPEARRWTA